MEITVESRLNAPTVTITADNTVIQEGTAATLTAAPAHDAANVTFIYQWYKDGVAIAGATESTFAAMESGSYTVKVTATDGTNTSAEVESNPVEITVESRLNAPTVTTPTDGVRTGDITSPQTGDGSNIALWSAAMLAAGVVLTGTSLYCHKKKYSK